MSRKSLLANTLITAMCIGATGGYETCGTYHRENKDVLNQRRTFGAKAAKKSKVKLKAAKNSRRRNRGKT